MLILTLLLTAVNCFTTNIKEFEAEKENACRDELTKTVDISGTYPGNITITITYNFDLASNGSQQIANTTAAMEAYKGAVKSNRALRIKFPKIVLYTLILQDTANELCRFTFRREHELPQSAKCAAWVGK